MIKTYCLVALLFIIAIIGVKGEESYGYIQNFWENNSINQIQKNLENNIFTDKNFDDLVNHNLGVLEKNPQNSQSNYLIENFGKNNIFDPIYLNYIFIIESKFLLNQKNKEKNVKLEGVPIKLNVCASQNLDDKQCILSRLFDKSNNQSLVNKLRNLYGDEQHRNLAYLYSTNPDTYYFKDYVLSLNYQKNGAIQISEALTGSNLVIPGTIETCVNQISPKDFFFDLKNNKIYNNRNMSITINDKNKDAIIDFMKDICSVNELSKLIRKEDQPNILTFHIKSIQQLENLLNEDSMILIFQIWNQTYQKFTQNILKKFKTGEISGQIILVQNLVSLKQRYEKEEVIHKFTQLDQIKAKPLTKRRILQNSNQSKSSKPDSQVFIWFFLFIAFVLFFAVMTLFNMEFERDSLLYAKFIATDSK